MLTEISKFLGCCPNKRRDRATDGQVEYTPTDAGRTLLCRRVERLADTCGLVTIDRAGDGTA